MGQQLEGLIGSDRSTGLGNAPSDQPMKMNPFQPNRPVHPAMFVGRGRELDRLEDHLAQAKAGNASAFLLTGERGIGKSSLLLYAQAVAQDTESADHPRNFLVVHTDLDPQTSQLGLMR